eukprot:347555_1
MVPSNKIIKGNESGIIIKDSSIDYYQHTDSPSIQSFIYTQPDNDTPNLPQNKSLQTPLSDQPTRSISPPKASFSDHTSCLQLLQPPSSDPSTHSQSIIYNDESKDIELNSFNN